MPNFKKRREFGEGLIYTSTNYIFWFLQGNFYFWLMNIPFIIVFLLMLLTNGNDFGLLLAISAIPIGPALTALFGVMGRLLREKDVNVTSYFFQSYKANFLESIFFWVLELIIISIIYMDKLYVLSQYNAPVFQMIFLVLMFMSLSMIFHIFPIISRFYFSKTQLIKMALYYSIKKIHISILSLALIYIMWLLLLKVPKISLLVILLSISIMCYIVMYLHKGTLSELEEKIKNQKN